MKSATISILFIIGVIQLISAQEIKLTYKIKCIDTLYTISENAFSDKFIQTKFEKLISKTISNKNILSIEDNINRKFEKINFKNATYYAKLINEGFYNLFELEVNNKPVYFIISKNDTVILERNDTIVDGTIINDRNYNGKLVLLCKEYPELWEKAGKLSFSKDDMLKIVTALNLKHGKNKVREQEKNRFDFLNFSLKGMILKNKTDIMLEINKSHYFVNISPNLSFKYGLKANYLQQTEFFPKLFSGWYYTGQDGIRHEAYVYPDHYETMSAKILEFPFSINFENTNSKITPYFSSGFAPTIFFRKITRTDSAEINKISVFNLNIFAVAGIKFKLSRNLNILSEYRFDKNKGLSLEFGIDYFLKL